MDFGFGKEILTDQKRRELSDNRFLDLPAGTTHLETAGPPDGSTVVFIHGLTSAMFIWDEQFYRASREGYRVNRYDLFGRGLSDRPDARYDAEFYRRQLNQLLDRLLTQGPVTLVGLSLGGGIAVDFTVHFPEVVDRLFLIAPAGLPESMPWWYHVISAPVVSESLYYSLGNFFFRYYSYRNLTDDPSRREAARKAIREQLRFKGYLRAIVSTLRHGPVYGLSDTYRALGELSCPVEAVWSRTDPIVPYPLHERLLEYVPSATVHSVESGQHTINYDRPDPVNRWLLDFMG